MNRIVCIALLFFYFDLSSVVLGKSTTEVSWEMLQSLNYVTGEMPDSLRQMKNQLVEIAGFIVPIEMDETIDYVKEFFLVPDPLSCIHVPPPAPNQMIYVEMKKKIPLDMDLRGILIKGMFDIYQSDDGTFSFELFGKSAKETIIPYDDPFLDLIGY